MPLPHFLRHFFCYDPFPDMLPRRERRKPSLMYFIPIADFNPRSREGSDQWLPILFVHSKISIHAPARGATEVFRITPSMKLFQSTLPRVERRATSTWSCCRRVFQSTLPRVERRGKIYVVCSRGAISIHAPASGATVIFPLSSCSVTFQSTLPRVERRRRRTQTKRLYRFQSTLPRVERLLTIRHSDRSCRFQSTLPRVERLGSV